MNRPQVLRWRERESGSLLGLQFLTRMFDACSRSQNFKTKIEARRCGTFAFLVSP